MDSMVETRDGGDGILVINGKAWRTDSNGHLVPEAAIKTQYLLEDQMVRKVLQFAVELSAQVRRFREHTLADIASFDADLEAKYGLVKRGRKGKGNVVYTTFDGLMKVEVKTANDIVFGPELQVAKGLIDQCLVEWSADSRPEIQSIIANAFDTDKQGKINRSAIYMLLRYESEDPRWQRAMEAIRDSMRVIGRREYVRFAIRDSHDAEWRSVTIDIANA